MTQFGGLVSSEKDGSLVQNGVNKIYILKQYAI